MQKPIAVDSTIEKGEKLAKINTEDIVLFLFDYPE
jgi:hypothetical protein